MHAQALSPTIKVSIAVPLSAGTATQADEVPQNRSPIHLTFAYPVDGVNSKLPWIMLMSGANCYSTDYSAFMHQMAGRGYLVAVADVLHPVEPTSPFVSPVRESHCPKDSWSAPTASIFNDVFTILVGNLPSDAVDNPPPAITLDAATQQAISTLNVGSAVVFAHSIGVQVVTNLLSGVCADPKSRLCGRCSAISDKLGDSVIKGVIAFEGIAEASLSNLPYYVPANTFMTYMTTSTSSGERTRNSYRLTRGARVQHIRFATANHYAVTNWNPKTAPHQRAPCGLPLNTAETHTTEEQHAANLHCIAQLTDVLILSQLFADPAAKQYLKDNLMHDALVAQAEVTL